MTGQSGSPDEGRGLPAPEGEGPAVHRRVCPLCEAMCGIRVTVEGDRVLHVRPDPDNLWSEGHMCPKGTTLGALHHDPDRIRMPMIRGAAGWRDATWEEAFARVAELVAATRAARPDGRSACYFGNMMGKGYAASRYPMPFLATARLDQFYSSATVDTHPRLLVNHQLYGNMSKMPIPDIDRTDLMLIMGGNPAVSKGNFFCHNDIMGAVRALQERGGKLIVVDPIRTATADKADQWISIRPGTDAAMLLALIHVVFERGAERLGAMEGLVNGLDEVRALAARYSPERVSDFCGVPAETVRALAVTLIAADRAALYGRLGLCNQEFGTLSTWAMDVLIAITGNLDRIGGTLWATEIAKHSGLSPSFPPDAPITTRHTRVRGAPEILGQYPASCLAEEIDTPGEGQVTIFVTLGANPARSAPNSALLERGLSKIPCMISFDNYLNETTRHAHVLLPGVSLLEQPHWDVFGWPYALKIGGHYSPATFATEPGRPDDWEVILRLAAILGGQPHADIGEIDDGCFADMCRLRGIDPATALAASPSRGPERMLDLAIRSGPFGDGYGTRDGLTLRDFQAQPDGILLGRAEPQGAAALKTVSGKVEIASPYILADIGRLDAAMSRTVPEFLLIGRRHLRSLNSWLHNVEILMKGKERCTLLIHPDDAARVGIGEGDPVEIASASGRLSAPAEISETIRPGLVSLPHGWGHEGAGLRMQVASRHKGVNTNVLTPGDMMDAPSGNAVLNGIPVTIRPAAMAHAD